MSEYAVQMQGIYKAYGSNEVLHGVDFALEKGSIHALLGENGTGKTTLMNILAGVIPGNRGTVTIGDKSTELKNTIIPMHSEIAFIHQELALVNDMNVYENMFLGNEIHKGIWVDKKAMYEKAKETLDFMEIDLDPGTMLSELNASYKQIIEIAKALMREAKVIIMDEPTTALTNVEIEHVFQIMRRLRDQGVSLVFISHKLNEVIEVCDTYTVMRDGLVIRSDKVTPELTENEIARLMVGKELKYDDLYIKRTFGEEIFRTEHLSREREFEDISIHVSKGEIVGITGLLGDGRMELMNTVFGVNKDYQGSIFVHGREQKMTSIRKASGKGISMLPRNRKENAIIKDLSVAENLNISQLGRDRKICFINKKKETETVADYIQRLNIKVNDTKDLITSLSGGNQQKVILARVLNNQPELIILDNPTQGVDVGAKLEIYGIIMKLAEQGVSFVVLTSEAQEVLMLCDRIYVMFHGQMRHEFQREDATEENIMIAATGGNVEE